MSVLNAIKTDGGITIPPRIEVRVLFSELPEPEKELLVEILEISREISARGTNIKPDGSIDTTVNQERKRCQEVRVGQGQRINEATTENSLLLDTTQWSRRNGLWAVQRESEAIDISSQQFQANHGLARRDRFSVARVTTTGRNVPGFGFGVGSMHHLVSDSMPIDAPKITTQTEIGPRKLNIEKFDGQTLTMLLERFKDRLRAAL